MHRDASVLLAGKGVANFQQNSASGCEANCWIDFDLTGQSQGLLVMLSDIEESAIAYEASRNSSATRLGLTVEILLETFRPIRGPVEIQRLSIPKKRA